MDEGQAMTEEQELTIFTALDTCQIMLESIEGLPIKYSASDVRPGHFVRELNLLQAAKLALADATAAQDPASK
jgi:hypothetical protein